MGHAWRASSRSWKSRKRRTNDERVSYSTTQQIWLVFIPFCIIDHHERWLLPLLSLSNSPANSPANKMEPVLLLELIWEPFPWQQAPSFLLAQTCQMIPSFLIMDSWLLKREKRLSHIWWERLGWMLIGHGNRRCVPLSLIRYTKPSILLPKRKHVGKRCVANMLVYCALLIKMKNKIKPS